MKHLDEGTIHAWLDGGLSAIQSAEVDAHVKACAECSAKVAEARGLIAASSRILMALDDTPANVVPKPASAPVRRRRSIAPWVSGLAAAAILITLWRSGDVQHPEPMADLMVPEIPRVVVPEPTLGPLSQPAPPPAAVEKVASRNPVENQAKAGNVASGAGVAGGVVRGAAASDLASVQVTAAPSAPAAAPVAAAAAEEGQRREAIALESMRRERTDTVTLEGCYPFLEAVVVTGANVVESRAPERAMRARGVPAPAAQKATADAVAPTAALRLDTANVVWSVASIRPIGSWQPAGTDSVRVTIGTTSMVLAKANKVRCP